MCGIQIAVIYKFDYADESENLQRKTVFNNRNKKEKIIWIISRIEKFTCLYYRDT